MARRRKKKTEVQDEITFSTGMVSARNAISESSFKRDGDEVPAQTENDAEPQPTVPDALLEDSMSATEESSSSEVPPTPDFEWIEIKLNGITNVEDFVYGNGIVEAKEDDNTSVRYFLHCHLGEKFPDLTPPPSKDMQNAFGVVLRTGPAIEDIITFTHNGNGIGMVELTEELIGDNAQYVIISGIKEPCLVRPYLEIFWDEVTPPEPDDSLDVSDSEVYIPEWAVTFAVREPSGKTRIAKQKSFPAGTAFSTIRTDPEIATTIAGMQSRSSGYWYFKGWSQDFSGDDVLTADITSWAKFDPAEVLLEIDFNGATNQGEIAARTPLYTAEGESAQKYLKCGWGKLFTQIVPAPVKNEEPCAGIFLTTIDSERVVTRSHTSNGKGVTVVTSGEMGSSTVDGRTSTAPIKVSSCNLVVHWSEPLKWNTQEDLREAIGVIPTPFASDPSATVPFAYDDDSDASEVEVNFKTGFPASYTKPLIDPATGNVNTDARVITRRQVNTLGYIGTQEQFFAQCGGYHSFMQDVCDAIGGYPEGAILRFYDANINCLRTVYSLLDENTWNFLENGVDGIHWKYIDDNPELSIKIDYSDFIDLRDVLFVETGQPDFYEVPYDGYLQLHALSFCDMNSTNRDVDTEYARERVDITQHIVENGTLITYKADPIYENLQGGIETQLRGIVYLDVYNEETNTTNSIAIRVDGSDYCGASAWQATPLGPNGAYYQYKFPRYVVSQGATFLNKGDKIRIRGSYTDQISPVNLGDVSRVNGRVLTDKEVKRQYLTKFANFYRVGWEG